MHDMNYWNYVEKPFVPEQHRRRLHVTIVDYPSDVPVQDHDLNQVFLVLDDFVQAAHQLVLGPEKPLQETRDRDIGH